MPQLWSVLADSITIYEPNWHITNDTWVGVIVGLVIGFFLGAIRRR